MLPETFLSTVLALFNEHGPKFKLDELASRLRMSKKTIYKHFASKEEILQASVREVFAAMHHAERAIVDDAELDIIEKLKRLLCVYPPFDIRYTHFEELGQMFPRVLKSIHDEFDANWDTAFSLMDDAIRQGRLAPVNLQSIRIILVGLFTEMLSMDIEDQPRLMRECVDIVFHGFIL